MARWSEVMAATREDSSSSEIEEVAAALAEEDGVVEEVEGSLSLGSAAERSATSCCWWWWWSPCIISSREYQQQQCSTDSHLLWWFSDCFSCLTSPFAVWLLQGSLICISSSTILVSDDAAEETDPLIVSTTRFLPGVLFFVFFPFLYRDIIMETKLIQ